MALARFYRTVQDLAGNTVVGVATTITLAGTTTLAPLFADAQGLAGLPNPVINDPTYGSITCFVAPGLYDIKPEKSGYSFQFQYGVSLTGIETGTVQLQASGMTVSGGLVPAAWVKNGRLVTLVIPEVQGTATGTACTLFPLPTSLYADTAIRQPISVFHTGAWQFGSISLSADSATMNLFPAAADSGAWAATNPRNIGHTVLTYISAS